MLALSSRLMIWQNRQAGTVVSNRLRSRRDRDPGNALQVVLQADHSEPDRRGDQLRDEISLPETDLEYERPAGPQAIRGLRQQPPHDVEPIGAPVERPGRFESNLGLNASAVAVPDVRRIRHDEVERVVDPFE